MVIRRGGSLEGKIASSEITPKEAFLNRRTFIYGAAALGTGAVLLDQVPGLFHPKAVHADQKLDAVP